MKAVKKKTVKKVATKAAAKNIKKKKKFTVALAIIARNEKKSSQVLIPKIDRKKFNQVYLIDGNSTDGTQAYYKKMKIPVFQQKVKGLGGATFEARARCKADAFVIFHPDGNEDIKDLHSFRTYFEEGADLVIPSRMIPGAKNEEDGQLFKPRKWTNIALVTIANILWGNKDCYATDPTQGYRGITVKAYDKLKLDMANLTIDYQMIIRALKKKLKIVEFPTHEGDRLFGETNFQSIPTGIAELKMLWREIKIWNKF
jgi:hypothetical protein